MNAMMESVATLANYQELQRAERLLDDALGILAKAQTCGIQCDELQAAVRQVKDRAAAIKQHFFSPPPTR